MEILNSLELLLNNMAERILIVLEFMGVIVITASSIKGFYDYIRHSENTKISLAKGLSIALEFKMGSEILRTVIVREWAEIATVAGIIVLRAALAFLIHWEIKQEEG